MEEQKVVEKFEVDCADQGQMGYRMVQEAMKAERPICCGFCGYAYAAGMGWCGDG